MNKYCIYKNPSGDIEVWEYIDSITVAKEYWYVEQFLDKYGIEGNFPICMNKFGGFHPCDNSRKVAIIEAEDFPNIATHRKLFERDINAPDFTYGWIDTEGNTYSCAYMQHTSMASDFCRYLYPQEYSKWRLSNVDIPDDFLVDKGWIRVSMNTDGTDCTSVDYSRTSNEAMKTLSRVKGESF